MYLQSWSKNSPKIYPRPAKNYTSAACNAFDIKNVWPKGWIKKNKAADTLNFFLAKYFIIIFSIHKKMHFLPINI